MNGAQVPPLLELVEAASPSAPPPAPASVPRLRAAVRALALQVGELGGRVDPSVVLLLLDGAGDAQDEGRAPSVAPPGLVAEGGGARGGGSALSSDEDRRKRLAADRAARYRARHAPSVTASVTTRDASRGRSVTERDGERDASRSERDASRSTARARSGFTSFEASSSDLSSAPSPLLSSSSSLLSSEQDPTSRSATARAGASVTAAEAATADGSCPPLVVALAPNVAHADASTAPVGARGGKRTDRAAWALLDACARAHHGVTRTHPSFAPFAQSALEPSKHQRIRMYDACVRALSEAARVAPTLPVEGRFELALDAYRRHVTGGRPFLTFGDHAIECVRAVWKRREREAVEAARASSPPPLPVKDAIAKLQAAKLLRRGVK